VKEAQRPTSPYVRTATDLPDYDLVFDLDENGLVCHIRYYFHNGAHVVIAGRLKDGFDPIGNAKSVAMEVAECVVPAEQEFTFIAYTPQWPLSSSPHFHDVTFELEGCAKRPSAALFEGDSVALACFKALDLASVESLTGRPVLTFPYALYTKKLAEAMNGQPARRLFELLIEAGLACPAHGPSPYGEYCSRDPRCEEGRNNLARAWRAPYRPRRHSVDGVYIGTATDRSAHIELAVDERLYPMPIFDLNGPEVAWGYGGSGAHEAAICILADYLGFLPRPQLRMRFVDDVVSELPSEAFQLPVHEIDRWFDAASRRSGRGLVFVASPMYSGWLAGQCEGISGWIGRGLLEIGCDVYEPALNAAVPAWKNTDLRLHGLLHVCMLAALEACSMIVIPYDGEATMQSVECATALRYALEHPEAAATIACVRAEGSDLARVAAHGLKVVPVGDGIPRDVGAVLEAVDRACAAYECFSDADSLS
jgi:hypothetical protein